MDTRPERPYLPEDVSAPHQAGRDRDGRPLYRGTEGEWRAMWRRLMETVGTRRKSVPEPAKQEDEDCPPW